MVCLGRWMPWKVTLLPRNSLPILARRAVKAFVKPAVPVRIWRLGEFVSVGTSMVIFHWW